MKKSSLKDFFNGKGFYITLIAAVSIVLVLAIVLSLSTPPDNQELSSNTANNAVNNTSRETQSTVPPFTPELDKAGDAKGSPTSSYNVASANPTTTNGSRSNEIGMPSFANEYNTSSQAVMSGPRTITDEELALEGGIIDNEAAVSVNESPQEEPTATVSTQADTETKEKKAEASEAAATNDATAKEEPLTNEAIAEEETEDSPEVVTTFVSYTPESAMEWPLDGEVVMQYSIDTGIFNPTLHMYKTNSCISISAAAGTQVKAAAAGEVIDVFQNEESGVSVVVDHGNGWKTTYSQLQENVLVSQGQIVTQGQVIGGVSSPTRNSILLGDHLDFTVTKDETPQNPLVVLAK